jgi:ABC-2 type transport system ATP-binding protein
VSKAEESSTIFLSTHSLEIAEELCHRIAIITNGTLHIIGTMGELRKKAGRENQDIDLEEIFLELTGAWEMQQVIAALKDE